MESIFLKIDGISGESKDAAHQGWIDVKSYSWGVRRTAGTGPGKASYRNLAAHCYIDKATSAALLFASNGNLIKKVQLSLCKSGKGMIESCRVTLENVIISEVTFEEVNRIMYVFQADRVKFQYWEQTAAGLTGAESRMGWDIKNSSTCF